MAKGKQRTRRPRRTSLIETSRFRISTDGEVVFVEVVEAPSPEEEASLRKEARQLAMEHAPDASFDHDSDVRFELRVEDDALDPDDFDTETDGTHPDVDTDTLRNP